MDCDCEGAALAALARGDRDEALDLLMRCYGRSIYRYCRRMLEDAAAAEDVLQTTFLEAYRDLERFARRSSLRAWLFGIAVHRCLDSLKRLRRWEKRATPLDSVAERAAPGTDAEAGVASAWMTRALERCLEELASSTRMAVLLRYVEGLSYPDMAVACRQQPAALQARVARALPVLRRCLERGGVVP